MNYDVIVIGGGPGGYHAAEQAGHAGLKTLCIEQNKFGGVCLNEGCIPTKTLLYSAKLYDGAVHGDKYGVTTEGASIDHAKVVARKDKVVKLLVSGVKNALKAHNAEALTGMAVIDGKDENGKIKVNVGEETYTADNIIIATGSSAFVPPITGAKEGMDSGMVMTNREILAMKEVPKKLAVVGGGVIGLEMASYFNSIGSEVVVIEMLDHIAGESDSEMGELLKKNYERKGVKFLLSTKVCEITETSVKCEKDGEELIIDCDKVLMSVGRRANTVGIGLETLGVNVERGAIVTDLKMRTNVENVYAVGDVNGKSMLAHTAYREADVAVNMILGKDDEVDYNRIPSVIYTNPELSSIGETENSAKAKGMNVKVEKLSMRFSGRYLAENEGGDGIFKLIINLDNNKVVGAQALCNYSSEFIVSVGVMMEAEMTVEQIKKVVFPHPTVCEIVKEAIYAN